MGALAGAAACEHARVPTQPLQAKQQASTAAKPPRFEPFGDGTSFQTITSTRFDFSIPLPDGASFRIDDRTDRWLVATHSETSSTLLVRAWREYELMNRRTCEQQARLYRTLPERVGDVVVEEKRIDAPPDHDTIVDVRIRERAEAPRVEGTVLAFGGWAHRCFAFVFVTRHDDKAAVAARLSTIVHGTLLRMKFQSDLVPRRTPPDLETPLRLETPERLTK